MRLPNRVVMPTMIPTLMMPPVPSVAPGYRAPQAQPSAARIVGVTAQPFVGISLQDAIAMALLKNNNLAISASNFRVAAITSSNEGRVRRRAAFGADLELLGESAAELSWPPAPANRQLMGRVDPIDAPSLPETSSSTSPGFQYGVSGQTESGGAIRPASSRVRTYNNTLFDAFNPYYLATLNLAVTQPLLKNLGMNATKRELKLAIVNADSGVAQTLVDASSTISQVETTYWDLVAAWRNVAIQQEALREAIAQQQSNVSARSARRGRADRGGRVADASLKLPRQPLHGVAARLGAAESAQGFHRRQAQDPLWNANLVPSTRCRHFRARAISRRWSREAELTGRRYDRPKTNALRLHRSEPTQRIRRFRRPIFKCSTRVTALPASPRRSRRSSIPFVPAKSLSACPTPPPNTQGAMAWAYHNMWAGYFPTFNIALIVGYPIQGHVAKGLRGLAGEETKQAELSMQGVYERIGAEARNALQSYQSALSKLDAARTSRESAESVIRTARFANFTKARRRRFWCCNGSCNSTSARLRELQAQTQLNHVDRRDRAGRRHDSDRQRR